MIHPSIYIGDSGEKGRGVFCSEPLEDDVEIERSPVIVMTAEDRQWIDKTLLHDYIFEWGEKSEQCCMALGYIAVYNHSFQPNCVYEMDFDTQFISIRTLRKIEAGEELFVNYNGDQEDKNPLWFRVT